MSGCRSPLSCVLGLTLASCSLLSVATEFELPADGSAVIGADTTITAHYEDTLLDIARRYSLGYDEIILANPGVDMWLPGEGRVIRLPGRRILPPGPRKGVVVSLAEHRLYFFPRPKKHEKAVVITYPVSIGKMGRTTPIGTTHVAAKVEHPSWYPTDSVRKEHAASGDILPAVVGPGPDNPLGDYMIRLALGDGTYEIHGTNNPTAVGLAITHGCIRMYPEDVAQLFTRLAVGTPVRLINAPVKLAWIDGELLLEAHPPLDLRETSAEPAVGEAAAAVARARAESESRAESEASARSEASAASQAALDEFSRLLRAAVGEATVAIDWDYAREVLGRADGVIATVGIQAADPSAPGR